ncbi:MAG TPA: hypothetical protein VH724_10570, partial [Candidatus Angelobacter sp.]|nr:hypothetical protein [Candidatus Angelobacter sp.]
MAFVLAIALLSPGHAAASQQPDAGATQAAQPASSFMLPPGTKLPLGLLRPLTAKAGRDVYLQVTFPVTVGSQMMVPPGSYVQGEIERIIRKNRRRDQLEFELRNASLIFSNGYTVAISGTVKVATTTAEMGPQQPSGASG